MLIKYNGGRSVMEVSLNRRSYHFTKENNHTIDIMDKDIINYIFSMPNRSEFEVVVAPVPVPAPILKPVIKELVEEPVKEIKKYECQLCNFSSNTTLGLKIHNATKHK